jgi:dipeptidyl aminopeptidase/acylaminoacyl peptidase
VDLHILSKTGVELQNDTVSIGVLTRTPIRSSQLTWSPDGRYLALIPVFTDGDQVYGRILLIRTGLTGAVPLLSGTSAQVSGLSWSPDGRWLAYSVGHEIWAASLEAYENKQDHLVRLTTSAGYELNWQTAN